MKRFDEILAFFELPNMTLTGNAEEEIVALTIDSRQVQKGTAFIALSGERSHGITYADQAIHQGVSCILTDSAGLAEFSKHVSHPTMTRCPIIEVVDLDKRLAEFAKWFYDAPSGRVKVIGVTGTNGKTSSSHYMAQMLNALNYKVALLGTLGNGWFGDLKTTQNTTVDVVTLNHLLSAFAEQQADYVVMEVSSHAIELGRIAGISFDVVAMTQVTRDHLDFHRTEAAYQAAKKKLFLNYPSRYQVVNADDSVGQAIQYALKAKKSVLSYSQKDARADVTCLTYDLDTTGIKGTLSLQQKTFPFVLPLMGQFNLENVLCAVSVVSACGAKIFQIQQSLTAINAVSGRMELLTKPGKASVLVDYAHTPDALAAVLKAAKHHISTEQSKLWVVFGCGGDRDSGKRPLMGQVAETYADEVVLTDDNPRTEAPDLIVSEIQKGMHCPVTVIHKRPEAIAYAIEKASHFDMVVVAGKGHEDYQEIQGKRWPMSDQKIVKALFNSAKAGSV